MANGHGTREAFVEALAGRFAHHARALRWDVAEQIRAALRNAGVIGDRVDAGHLVGALPPGLGGLPPPAEITDDAGVVLLDDDGTVLVTETGAASADHTHPGGDGMDEATADARYVPRLGGSVMEGSLSPLDDFGTDLGTAVRRFDTVRAAYGRLARDLTITPPWLGSGDPLAVWLGGESFPRLTVGTDGMLRWGPGTVERDASLGRTGAGTLGVTGALGVSGALAAGGKAVAADPAGGNTLVWNAAGFYVPAGTPAAHHASHEPGGSDPMAVDAAAATGSLRTLGTGATQAAAGSHAHAAATVPACRAYHNTNYSLAHNTPTVMPFNSERFDTDTIHDNVTNNGRLTCRTAGVYLITASIEFAANATGVRYIALKINSSTYVAIFRSAGLPGGNSWDSTVTTIYQMAVSDYAELEVFQDSGAALNVVAIAATTPEFAMARIG